MTRPVVPLDVPRRALTAVLAAAAFSVPAIALAVSWDLTCASGCTPYPFTPGPGAWGNERAFTAAGGEVLAARAFTTGRSGGGLFEPAFLGRYAHGLGVTAPGAYGDGNGSSLQHTVDNIGKDDLIVFRLPGDGYVPVSLFLEAFGDTDVTAFVGGAGKSFADFTSLSYATLAASGFTEYTAPNAAVATPDTGALDRTVGLNLTPLDLGGRFLVVGARLDCEGGSPSPCTRPEGSPDDRFKIASLAAEASPDPPALVPEPATLLLLGSGLAGLGLLARRRPAA